MAKPYNETAKIQLEISDFLESEGADIERVRLFLNSKTLRLTKFGYAILNKFMKSWAIETDEALTTEELILLLRKVRAPYYIRLNKKEIILFSEEDAFMARIAGVKGWIQSK